MKNKEQTPRCWNTHDCVLDHLADAVMVTDRDGRIEYANPAFEKITGYRVSEVIGETPSLLKSGRQDKLFYEQVWGALLAGQSVRDVFVNRRKDGSVFYDEKTITPLFDEQGVITHFIAIGKDITDRIQQDERLTRLAYYDSLTGLANRVLFRDRLVRAMRRTQRSENLIAVAFLDLDAFKPINDDLGHRAGDQLLCEVAGRLKVCLRATDTVARFAGDEFLILLEGLHRIEDASRVLDQISAIFNAPFTLDGHQVSVRASMGVALYPFSHCSAETLIQMADLAMYRAKRGRLGGYCFYEHALDDDSPSLGASVGRVTLLQRGERAPRTFDAREPIPAWSRERISARNETSKDSVLRSDGSAGNS